MFRVKLKKKRECEVTGQQFQFLFCLNAKMKRSNNKNDFMRHMKKEHRNLNVAGERMNKKDNNNLTEKHFQNNDHVQV